MTAIPEALPGFQSKNPVLRKLSLCSKLCTEVKASFPILSHPSPAHEVAAGVKIKVPTHSSVSFLLSSMKAMDSDLRRFVTSYVRRVTPKISSWYRLSSWERGWQREKRGLERAGVGPSRVLCGGEAPNAQERVWGLSGTGRRGGNDLPKVTPRGTVQLFRTLDPSAAGNSGLARAQQPHASLWTTRGSGLPWDGGGDMVQKGESHGDHAELSSWGGAELSQHPSVGQTELI